MINTRNLIEPSSVWNHRSSLIVEIISLFSATILLFSYMFLPWIIVDDQTRTAFELLSVESEPITLITPGFVLPTLAILAGIVAILSLRRGHIRRLTASILTLIGLSGVIYFALIYRNDDQTILQSGFWLTLLACLWFILQSILPRSFPQNQIGLSAGLQSAGQAITGVFKELYRNRFLYLLALPGIIWMVIFAYIPMSGHLIAFKNFRANLGIFGSDWSGFKNFEFFFSSGDWLKVTGNTVFLNLMFVIASLGTALLLAIFLNELRMVLFKRMAQSLVLLPNFISWLVVSVMFFALFNSTDGLVNRTLTNVGIDPVSWYSTPGVWPLLLTLVDVWKGAGYTSIIFLAAITAIPDEYYESAMIDGANKLQQMRFITLPLLVPTAIILGLLALGRIFYGNFEMIYSLVGDNGILFSTTNVIDTYTFRALRQLGNFGMTAAVGLYQSVLGLIAVIFFNWLVKRINSEVGLF